MIYPQDPMYSSGDLWQQLLEKEKEKVRELEERYAEKMREKGVSTYVLYSGFNMNLQSRGKSIFESELGHIGRDKINVKPIICG